MDVNPNFTTLSQNMMSPILTVSWVALGIALVLYRVFQRRRSIQYIRGPQRLRSLLGHDYEMGLQDDIGDLEFKWFSEYGATWRTQGAFGTDHLMTADPKALQHIYHKSAYSYAKKPSNNHMSYLLGGPGIVWVQGEAHQRHRKIMNPAFSASHLKSFLPLFQRVTSKLVEKWKTELSTTPELFPIINTWFSRATLDIIGEAAFDFDYGGLGDGENNALSKAYHGIMQDIEYRLPKSVMLFRAIWDFLPEPILKLFKYMPIHPFTRMLALGRIYESYGKRILREKRLDVDAEKEVKNKDIMSILIKANASANEKTRLADEELMAEMFTLTFAGHETTASTISFIMYELAKHPEYQARMRGEVKAARAQMLASGGVDFTVEDLDNMPLCLNAIKETLRFHPIVTYLHRVACQDDVIPLSYPITSTTGETITEIPITKGQVIITSLAVYNRLPQVWGEDAHVWNPDRFNRIDTGKQTNVGVFANLMTFSAGIRGCIGWRFSVIETQAMLADLIETFQFKLPVGAENVKDPKQSEVQCAPSGITMIPLIRGKPELGPAIRLRISLAESD